MKNFNFGAVTLVLGVSSIIGISACTPRPPQEVKYILPDELKDCKVLRIEAASSPDIFAVVCPRNPNSEVIGTHYSRSTGKATQQVSTVVINGERYQKVEERGNGNGKQQ